MTTSHHRNRAFEQNVAHHSDYRPELHSALQQGTICNARSRRLQAMSIFPLIAELRTFADPSFSSLVVARFDCVNIDSERSGEDRRPILGESHLSPLERAYRGRTDIGSEAQLGLSQSGKYAEVSQTARALRNGNEIGNFTRQRSRHLTKSVNLRGAPPLFPISDSRQAHISKSREVGSRHSQFFPAAPERVRDEVSQDSPAHALPSATVGHYFNLATVSHNARTYLAGISRGHNALVYGCRKDR